MKRISIIAVTSLLLSTGYAQNTVSTFDFVEHLNDVKAYQEGIIFLDNRLSISQSQSETDSLHYYKGVFQYRMKSLEGSIVSLSKVRKSSPPIFYHAKFLQSFQLAYSSNNKEATTILEGFQPDVELQRALKNHLLAGNSLLVRDFQSFDYYRENFNSNFYQLTPYQEQLAKNYEGLKQTKKKSGAIAGILSGLVPGAGKFYLGKIGEGYTTLLISSILALAARESYRKDGVESTRFGIYAGLFSAVYIANIWGSVLSVKIYKDDFNQTFDEAILLNMHVPIRTIFD